MTDADRLRRTEPDRWVNANITLLVVLDDVTVDSDPYEKQEAVANAMERVLDALPPELGEHCGFGTWEDMSDEDGDEDEWTYTEESAAPRSVTRMKAHMDPSWAVGRIFELEAEVEKLQATVDRTLAATDWGNE
jgi:hypothetical protein